MMADPRCFECKTDECVGIHHRHCALYQGEKPPAPYDRTRAAMLKKAKYRKALGPRGEAARRAMRFVNSNERWTIKALGEAMKCSPRTAYSWAKAIGEAYGVRMISPKVPAGRGGSVPAVYTTWGV